MTPYSTKFMLTKLTDETINGHITGKTDDFWDMPTHKHMSAEFYRIW